MTRNIELSLKRRNNLLTGLEQISHKKIFVTWETIPAVPKDKKFPYLKNNILLRDSYNSSEVIDNLMTLTEAFEEQDKNRHTGVGISFFNNCGVVGVDLDKCFLNGKFIGTELQRNVCKDLRSSSYIEVSHSLTGLHAVALGNTNTNKKDNGHIELFGDKLFLALTGNSGKGVAAEIEISKIEKIHQVINEITNKSNTKRNSNSNLSIRSKIPIGKESIEAIRSALSYIDPSLHRDDWLKVIWAIHHGLGDTSEAEELSDQWSKGELYGN